MVLLKLFFDILNIGFYKRSCSLFCGFKCWMWCMSPVLWQCYCIVGPLLRVLVSVFAPIYWTTVLQNGEARNGFSFTQGQFRQESQLEFETGQFYTVCSLLNYQQMAPPTYTDIHNTTLGIVWVMSVFSISPNRGDPSFDPCGKGSGFWGSFTHWHCN